MAGSIRIRRKKSPFRAVAVTVVIFTAVFGVAYHLLNRGPAEVARAVRFNTLSINRDGAKKTFEFDSKPKALCPGDVIDVKGDPLSVETISGDKFTFKSDGAPLRIEEQDGNFTWKFASGELRGAFLKGKTRIEAGNLVVQPYADSSVEIKAPRDAGQMNVVSYLSGVQVVFKGVLLAQLSNAGSLDPEARVELEIKPSTSGIMVRARTFKVDSPVLVKSLADGSAFELHGDSSIEVRSKSVEVLGGDVRRIGAPPADQAGAETAASTAGAAGSTSAPETEPASVSVDPPIEPAKPPPPEQPQPAAVEKPADTAPDPVPDPVREPEPAPVAEAQPAASDDTPKPPAAGGGEAKTAPAVETPVKEDPPSPSGTGPGPSTSPAVEGPETVETAPAVRRAPVARPAAPPIAPQVYKIRGSVRIVRDQRVIDLPHGASPVMPGDVVKVGSNSSAYVMTPSGVKYVLRENSEFLYE